MGDDGVGRVTLHGQKLRLLPIGFVALLEQRGAAHPKITDLEAFTQETSQYGRITVGFAARDARAVSDAIPDAGDADWFTRDRTAQPVGLDG